MARFSAAFDRLPIRTRLALASAVLTFVILCGFAVVIGKLTVNRIRSDFNKSVTETARELPSADHLKLTVENGKTHITPSLSYFANAEDHSVARIYYNEGGQLIEAAPADAPSLGSPLALGNRRMLERNVNGYRVVTLPLESQVDGFSARLTLQYGRSTASTEQTVRRVELFLLLGVLGGSVLALLAGIMIARRAMKPISDLTAAAAEIERTRDPSRRIPQPTAEDEVAELAGTLQGMLRELDAARAESEAMLARQRRFVADASHELRTPLTSVLANLELLAESLHGEEGDAARSALRSSQRMRRLVADLLLLARTDAARDAPRAPCDLGSVVVEAAGELGPVSADHEIVLDARPAPVVGARDELHRVAINLIENAIRHTPPGSRIQISTRLDGAGSAELVVEDDGPGVPAELAPTLFERFVRGAGDRGGSFGLGLAIVRAVAVSHGGQVELQRSAAGGARFVVSLPAAPSDLDDDGQHHRSPLEPVVDQLR